MNDVCQFSDIRPHLRHALGDHDGERFEDAILDQGLRMVLASGQVADIGLADDLNTVTPAITDPNKLGLLIYRTAMTFAAPLPDSEAISTRAISVRRSGRGGFLSYLHERVTAMEDGTAFTTWSSFTWTTT